MFSDSPAASVDTITSDNSLNRCKAVWRIPNFYARKDWKSYTKRNLWAICIIDVLIAALYNLDIYLEPTDEYTTYMLTEIWIRPTITYGLVACFVTETEK